MIPRYLPYGVTTHCSDAVPLTLLELLCTPLLISKLRSAGACAVIVTVPTARQVACPVLLPMLAIDGSDVLHLRPSVAVNSRDWLLVNVPVAVNPTSPLGTVA